MRSYILCTAGAFSFYKMKFKKVGAVMSDYKALYRKWRPYNFDDVSGQKSVTDILKYEVQNGKISHAYLFCGSRGTGKTSCAKILAKAVNCLNPHGGNPCNECEACKAIEQGTTTDVIEMDAASNNGVDNVRNLKDEINFSPAVLKYRVYIVDEVHMMSSAAFNALLKTLEEPPPYVVFILATTELNKLPTTIISRCQRFDFKRMTSAVIMERLFKISEAEKIDLGEDGARLIARASRGGMRDAVSLLELCAGSRMHIDAELVAGTIGSQDRGMAYGLLRSIAQSDFDKVYRTVNEVVMSSADISVFWQEVIDSYRDIMVVKNSPDAREYLDLTEVEYDSLKEIAGMFSAAKLSYHTTLLQNAVADMQRAPNSKRSICEIALTKMCEAGLVSSNESLLLRIEELEKQISMLKLGVGTAATGINSKDDNKKEQSSTETSFASEKNSQVSHGEKENDVVIFDKWQSVVEEIAGIKSSLSGPLKNAEVKTDKNGVFYIYLNDFFAKRLNNNENDCKIIRGIIAAKINNPVDSITLKIISLNNSNKNDLSDDFDDIIK